MTVLSTTITGNYAPGTTANPFTIATTGEITASGAYALLLASSANWYVLNQGRITASSGDAVALTNGTIINSGNISGSYGVQVAGAAAVTNSGFISGITGSGNGAVYLDNQSNGQVGNYGGFGVLDNNAAATIVNAGTILGASRGVYAKQGLTLTNSGTIASNYWGIRARGGGLDGIAITNEAGGTIEGGRIGIYFGGQSDGTLVNAGTIEGSDAAVRANYTGITIDVVVEPGAVFQGSVLGGGYDRLDFAPGASSGTFAGLGSRYTGFSSYTVDVGASWTAADVNILNTITIEGTLAIDGTAAGPAVLDGGALAILAGATLSQDTGTSAITGFGGYVTNAGTITVTSGADAISRNAGGTVVNAGLIAGRYDIGITFGPGYVTNTGTILAVGASGSAIKLGAGGTVANSGTIRAGTSSPGAYLDAVAFAPGAGNTMILEPGSSIRGTVDGGNTLGAAASSTLELTGRSTLNGLNTQFTNFADVYIANGATWALGTYPTILAGQTVNGDGTITAGPDLLNQGTILVEVLARYGSPTITNAAGAFLASTTAAIDGYVGTSSIVSVLNAGTIEGYGVGIEIDGTANITSLSGGLIASTENFAVATGIFLEGGYADNQGTVVSQGYGIFEGYVGYGVPTVTNSGTVVGSYVGVVLAGSDALTNAGGATIVGNNFGIYVNEGGVLLGGGSPQVMRRS